MLRYAQKGMFTNHHPYEDGSGMALDSPIKNFCLKLKKCPHLHRKVFIYNHAPHWVGVGLGDQLTKFFVWNLMKCLDLQRSAMFTSSPSPSGVRANLEKHPKN